MNKIVTAVFDGEVLRPHTPLELEPDKSYAIAIDVDDDAPRVADATSLLYPPEDNCRRAPYKR